MVDDELDHVAGAESAARDHCTQRLQHRGDPFQRAGLAAGEEGEPAVAGAVDGVARLVLSEATWGERDYTCQQRTRAVQTAHRTLRPHIEVENVETALEIAARGHADTIAARGVAHRLAGQLPHRLHSAPLRPRLYDHFAIVHRRHTTLSRATRTLIDLVTTRLRQATARGRQADP